MGAPFSGGIRSGPRVDSVTPGSGTDAGGTAVTVEGEFFTGATSCTFDGVELTSMVVVDDFTITGVTAAHWVGYVDVSVSTAFGSDTLEDGYRYAGIFDFDFTTLALGGHSAASFLTATAVDNPGGLVFTRSTVSTVQTDAETIDSTPGVNYACVGNLGSTLAKRGLVVQHTTENFLNYDPRSCTGWNAGEGSNTNNAAVSPDGQTKAIHCVTGIAPRAGVTFSPARTPAANSDGQFGFYAGPLASSGYRMTAWMLGGVQMATNTGGNPGSTSQPAGANVAVASCLVWTRVEFTSLSLVYFAPTDGRDYQAFGGALWQARGTYADFINAYRGTFSVEAIETAAGVRATDVLTYATGSQLIAANGQLKVYAQLSPKFASTEDVHVGNGSAATGYALWAYQTAGPVFSHAYIRQSDHKLVVKIGAMTAIVSTNAIAFAKYDTVEVYVAVGNSVASVAKYRLNGGSWVDLVLATITNAPAPSTNAIHFLGAPFVGINGSDLYGWPSHFHRLTIPDASLPPGL